MKVKTSDLRQIIAQASCLSERLSKQLQVTDSEQQLISRLQRWCKVSARGDWEKLHKRLLWDGLDIEQVQQILRSLPIIDAQILPVWAEILRAMIETAANFHSPFLTPINPQNPLVFQELLLPAISVARQQLLNRLGTNFLSREYLPLKVLKICDRSDYGWVEYVEHLPCKDEAAAQRFYQRAGMLLCLLYILRVTDSHHENLVANGEHFVLVDMETLMQPEAKLMTDFPEVTEVEKIVEKQFWDSVLRTGLLPRWHFLEKGCIAYQNNSLSRCQNHPSPAIINIPMLNGLPLEAGDYLDEIVWGFEQMYRLLISHQQILLAEDSPLTAFQNVQVRFMFRMSQVYGKILEHIQHPKWLCNGIDKSIEIDHLSRAFLVVEEKPHNWEILSKEIQAMEQLDIPYFSAFPGSDELVLGSGESIAEYLQEPSYKTVQTQLESLSEADLARQVEIIKGCFYAQGKSVNLQEDSITPDTVKSQNHNLVPLTKEQLLKEATRLGEEIQARAIWGSDGSVNWIGFNYFPNANCFQFEPLGDNLYNGNSGIALFLAALDYVKGTKEFRELVMGGLFSIRKFLQRFDSESHRRFVRQGIGGGMGLGSLIYGLVTISQFLGESALVEDAVAIANLITPELIAGDEQFNLIYGASGAILGLLSLYNHTQEPNILERAINCSEHLLNHQVHFEGIPQAWNILQQGQYTGFFYGAGGIAYALLRLYAVTRDSAYFTAAKAAIIYERSVFLHQSEKNMQFSRFDIAGEVLLGRVASLSILNTSDVYQELEKLLETTQKYIDVDSIECGNFGKVEILLLVAQQLERPELRQEAIFRASCIVNDAQIAGGYQFLKLPSSVFNPGLFQGTAGMGYQLLRLVEESLPSVLLF